MRPPTQRQIDRWCEIAKVRVPAYAGRVLSDIDIREMVTLCFHIAQPTLKPSPASTAAAFRSLAHLSGKTADEKMVMRNLTRILANWHFIREEMEVPVWDGTATDANAVFIGVSRLNDPGAKGPKMLVMMKLKSGLCAGIIQCAALFERSIQQFLDKQSGTSRMQCAVEEIAGMQARVCITAMNTGLVSVNSWDCTEAQKKHNRDLAERRMDPLKCRLAPQPCNVCNKNIKECPLAVWLPKPKKES